MIVANKRMLIRLAQRVTFMYMNVNAKESFLVREPKNLLAELEMISQSHKLNIHRCIGTDFGHSKGEASGCFKVFYH